MTITTQDPNRLHWEAAARREALPWEDLGAEADGITELPVDNPSGLWLHPPNPLTGPVVLAIHGGGFVSGSVSTHRRMFGQLARSSSLSTFAVEYGLVPEQVFPSQLDTVTNAYRWLLGHGATRVALLGDSCGATLALGLALRARDEGLPPPAALMLISAWTDLEATGASYDHGRDPFFTREVVRGLGAAYLAGADPRNPLASPLHADPRGLPPTYLQVGGEEALLDDSQQLADQLRAAGVEVRIDVFPGQLHTFQMGAGRTAVADRAVASAAAWLRSTLVP
ncbi:MAG: alpha/beta hydrolase [Propionibacteriaceae bacterium]